MDQIKGRFGAAIKDPALFTAWSSQDLPPFLLIMLTSSLSFCFRENENIRLHLMGQRDLRVRTTAGVMGGGGFLQPPV